MMESDEESEFRRRDKFRSERGGGPPPRWPGDSGGPPPMVRGHWRGRGHIRGPPPGYALHHVGEPPWRRGPPPDRYYGPPPVKRSRVELEMFDDKPRPGPLRQERRTAPPFVSESSHDGFLPPKMTFKAFLATQDDSITDEEAAHKYSEYKLEFKRQHLNEFFSNHKDLEWFRKKYHPIDGKKRKEELHTRIVKRFEMYQQMQKKGFLENLELNVNNETHLVRALNKAVILMEGGGEQDLTVLDKSEEEIAEAGLKELHKTTSLFLKVVHQKVTLAELEEVCKKFTGFRRICVSAPDPNKKWTMKSWITYERSAKIREICFNLNNTRIKDKELDSVVNKDLSKRIRPVSGIYTEQKIARNDVRIAAKIITTLDARHSLSVDSPNPLLANVHDYLIEEVSAEEEELLKTSTENVKEENKEEKIDLVVNHEVLSVLDKLILYLRLVHSVDLYSHVHYELEDEMPNRLGLLHVRDEVKGEVTVSQEDIENTLALRENKLKSLTENPSELEHDQAVKLGLKTEADEVEKFIASNCQEINKDKWLCPLSGKKFKAPEFIRKHILNKFAEQVEKVKQETQFYNNYLRDPKRPELPERPPVTKSPSKATIETDETDAYEEETPRMSPKFSGRKRTIHDRLGRVGVRASHTGSDPRQIVDYSDVDLGMGPGAALTDSIF